MGNIAALAFAYALTLALSAVPLGLVMWGLSRLGRGLPAGPRTTLLVVSAAILFMPVWGPATIAVVPVPLGLVLLVGAATFDFQGLNELLGLTPAWWYPCAFLATALIAYAFKRLVCSSSSKPA